MVDVDSHRRAAARPATRTTTRTVVIAGFVNISGNADDDWLGTGHHRDADGRRGAARGRVDRAARAGRRTLKTLRQKTGRAGGAAVPPRGARAAGRGGSWSAASSDRMDAVRVTASLSDVASGAARADDARSTAASTPSSSCRIAWSASSRAPSARHLAGVDAAGNGSRQRLRSVLARTDQPPRGGLRGARSRGDAVRARRGARPGVRARAHRARRRLRARRPTTCRCRS